MRIPPIYGANLLLGASAVQPCRLFNLNSSPWLQHLSFLVVDGIWARNGAADMKESFGNPRSTGMHRVSPTACSLSSSLLHTSQRLWHNTESIESICSSRDEQKIGIVYNQFMHSFVAE